MDADLKIALAFHLDGRYADAASRDHALLARQPDHADALHLFGLMHHQCGHPDRAAAMIERALALRPGIATFHSNLAEVYRKLGWHQQAVRSCRDALKIQPDYPEAANNLGLALQALGRPDQAVEAYSDALRMRPGFALAWNNLGTGLRELGDAEKAVDAFRSALAAAPELAIARANLGQALLDAGETEPALEHCLEAARLDPRLAAAHNNLGNVYVELKRRAEAVAAYADALRLSPELGGAEVHATLGLALRREGKLSKAISCFLKAVELEPDDPRLWRHLASAHADEDDFAAAIPCLERIIVLKPEGAEGFVELGSALMEEGRLGEAKIRIVEAIALGPDCVEAIQKRGVLHENFGEMPEAEIAYRRALELEPGATAPLASLAILLRGRLPDSDRLAIQSRLEDPNLDEGPRSSLLFAMAHVDDARGDSTEAAAGLKRANAIALALKSAEGNCYDPDEHSRFVDNPMSLFTPELFSHYSKIGDETRGPIFVFGVPRSGTTLVEQILASHSQVHGAGELRLIREAFAGVTAKISPRRDGGYDPSSLDPRTLQAAGLRYLDRLHEIVERGPPEGIVERVVDKMPDNYLYLGLIAILFPKAALIHVRRDPRGVALSCWMTNFRSIRWFNDPDHIAARFHGHKRLTDHWKSTLRVPVHEVIYERLVSDFEPEARRLVSTCGLAWEPACLRFHETKRSVRTASVTQVRRPLYRKSVARWEHYREHLADLFERLPTATLDSTVNITAAGSTGQTTTVVVTYSAPTGSAPVDPNSFGLGNIVVDNGAAVTAFSAVGDVVTYTITPPDADWGLSPQGVYQVSIVDGGVKNTSGFSIAGESPLGTFNIDSSQTTHAALILTASPSPTAHNQTVRLTATVVGAQGPAEPSGTVTFYDFASLNNVVTLGSATVGENGVATLITSSLPVGVDTVRARYSGDSKFTAASNTIIQTVAASAAATHFSVTVPSNSTAGVSSLVQVVALDPYGNVDASSKGTVHFSSDDPLAALPSDTPLTNGVGTFEVTLQTAGPASIAATDTANPALTGTANEVVTMIVNGTVYRVLNANGTLDAGDPGLPDRVVFLDINGNNTLDQGDPSATTDANGHFALSSETPGTFPVRVVTGVLDAVDGSKILANGTVNLGLVPVSPVAPLKVILNPTASTPSTDADTAYVRSLYRALLGREGSADEVAAWLTKIHAGLSHQGVALGFVNSPEHRQKELDAYYENFLHRAPDSNASHWVQALMAGASEEKVVEGILDSPEYQTAHRDSADFIEGLYNKVLGRPGDPASVARWQSSLASGQSRKTVEAAFVTSSEAIDQVVGSFSTLFLRHKADQGTATAWSSEPSLPKGSAADLAVEILAGPEFEQEADEVIAAFSLNHHA